MRLKVCVRKGFALAAWLAVAALAVTVGATGSAAAYTEKVLYSFCSAPACADGQNPTTIFMDPSGTLYGTNESGVVFSLTETRNKWKFKALRTLSGSTPWGPLTMDVNGNLYGTTLNGGAHFHGTAYELSPATGKWKVKILHEFCAQGDTQCPDGAQPQSGLAYAGASIGALYDGVSPLYGTTFFGGDVDTNSGTVFQLTPPGRKWKETVLHSFCSVFDCADGSSNGDPVIVDGSGNLYGATIGGGAHLGGAIFRLAPNHRHTTWTETVLRDLVCQPGPGNCPDGQDIDGAMIFGTAGSLYGVAQNGGSGQYCELSEGCGALVEIASGGTYNVLYNFCAQADCADGSNPRAGMIMDGAGHLFGVADRGGPGAGAGTAGTVFEWDGTVLQTLYGFCTQTNCSDGSEPIGPLVIDDAGDIFGTTLSGGIHGAGTVFELVP
jgi:uncharacterized repeat protein (TIGR03803 family)